MPRQRFRELWSGCLKAWEGGVDLSEWYLDFRRSSAEELDARLRVVLARISSVGMTLNDDADNMNAIFKYIYIYYIQVYHWWEFKNNYTQYKTLEKHDHFLTCTRYNIFIFILTILPTITYFPDYIANVITKWRWVCLHFITFYNYFSYSNILQSVGSDWHEHLPFPLRPVFRAFKFVNWCLYLTWRKRFDNSLQRLNRKKLVHSHFRFRKDLKNRQNA